MALARCNVVITMTLQAAATTTRHHARDSSATSTSDDHRGEHDKTALAGGWFPDL
jgi:hypothetical protein